MLSIILRHQNIRLDRSMFTIKNAFPLSRVDLGGGVVGGGGEGGAVGTVSVPHTRNQLYFDSMTRYLLHALLSRN